VERPERAQVIARARHVERQPPLVERDEEAAEGVVERVDVVEQPEHVGLAPGEDLAADAEEERTLLEVDVAEEEAVALARDTAQEVDAALDVRVGEALLSSPGCWGDRGARPGACGNWWWNSSGP